MSDAIESTPTEPSEAVQARERASLEQHVNERLESGFREISARLNLQQVEEGGRERLRSLRAAAFLTAGVGLAFAGLFLLTVFLISRIPGADSTDADLIEFYLSAERRRAILVGTYVMPFAGIAFLWFIVALRMWINASTRKISELSSNLQLVTGIVFVGLFFTSAAATASTAITAEYASSAISPTAARLLPEFGSVLMIVFALRMAAMFVLSTSNIGRESKVLPRWFALAGYLVGVFLLLSSTLNPILVLVFPVWMIVLCVILLLRARKIPRDLVLPARGAGPVAKPVTVETNRTG